MKEHTKEIANLLAGKMHKANKYGREKELIKQFDAVSHVTGMLEMLDVLGYDVKITHLRDMYTSVTIDSYRVGIS